MVRKDIFDEWGWPEVKEHPEWGRVTLEEVLSPAEDVAAQLWLDPREYPVTWTADMTRDRSTEEFLRPKEVGHILEGGWGCRVYEGMVPATKASSWGPAGRTHLVAQEKAGVWRARRLSAVEIARIFDPDGVMRVMAADEEVRVAEFGNSGPTRMVLPYAEGLVDFLKPPMSFVPESMEEIIEEDTVQICRGWMQQSATDFRERAKLN